MLIGQCRDLVSDHSSKYYTDLEMGGVFEKLS